MHRPWPGSSSWSLARSRRSISGLQSIGSSTMTSSNSIDVAAPATTGKRKPSRSARRAGGSSLLRQGIKHAILIIVGILMLYPVLWLVVSSFRPTEEIFRDPGLFLRSIYSGNYVEGWNALTSPFGHYVLNSLLVAVGAILGNLISCSMAAYAFARLRFKGKRLWFVIMLGSIMLPIHVIIVPQYILFSKFGWVNTFIPLIAPKFLATDAFFVFLMVQFIRSIPKELDDSARLDGAGHPRIFL